LVNGINWENFRYEGKKKYLSPPKMLLNIFHLPFWRREHPMRSPGKKD